MTAPAYHPDQHLNTAAAALFVGRAAQTLENWRGLKRGPPFHRVGRSITYRVGDLVAWMTQHRQQGEA